MKKTIKDISLLSKNKALLWYNVQWLLTGIDFNSKYNQKTNFRNSLAYAYMEFLGLCLMFGIGKWWSVVYLTPPCFAKNFVLSLQWFVIVVSPYHLFFKFISFRWEIQTQYRNDLIFMWGPYLFLSELGIKNSFPCLYIFRGDLMLDNFALQ